MSLATLNIPWSEQGGKFYILSAVGMMLGAPPYKKEAKSMFSDKQQFVQGLYVCQMRRGLKNDLGKP